jgi:argininosuccinate synthase
VEERAYAGGASKVILRDLREEFLRDYVLPTVQAGAVYEGKYLLGTAMARPLIAKHQVQIALEEGADAVAHGATGKGNDQVRFELAYQALAPHLRVIAPWREWSITSRREAYEYARAHGCPSSGAPAAIAAIGTSGTSPTRAAPWRTRTGSPRRTSSSGPRIHPRPGDP